VPTYQYVCSDCGEGLEAVQKFSDDALTECPACGGKLRKIYSAVGVVFKGSGFYRTDSRSSGSSSTPATATKGDSAAGAPAASSTSSSSSSSSDSAPSSSTPAKKSGDSKVA
jgi:putative FmdB family regulatory protein